MTDSNSNEREQGNFIWSKIKFEELVDVIASLGDHVAQLKSETWRLNSKTSLPSSLWYQVIMKFEKLEHNEHTRASLYKIWQRNSHGIQGLVERKQPSCGRNLNQNGHNAVSITETNNQNLLPDLSLPLPERPNTRAKQKKHAVVVDDDDQNTTADEICITFTPIEWKSVFSRTDQKMKPDWRKVFYNKLVANGIECSVSMQKPYIKKGKRKHNCKFLGFNGSCSIGICPRLYQIILKDKPDETSSTFLRVKIYNEVNHDKNIATGALQLRGEERARIGQRANEIGPLAVYRERVEAANESLLEAGNHTECETVAVIKKAGADVRKKMLIDENIYRECDLIAYACNMLDTSNKIVPGYIQYKSEIPFCISLYSEPQIERYIRYCKKEKYSFIHLDATGNVLRPLRDQKQLLLYAIIFKDGTDGNDTVPLAHGLLTRHTVPSITNFLLDLVYNINQTNDKKPVRPSFFIIDFSAAMMNSILHAFNEENIISHLNRCWNVVCGNYNSTQLRSLSFIHLCCCHVIHAVARSLTAARINKKTRRGVLHIFAFILCENDMKQLYDVLGIIINIFGDPSEQNAEEKFEQMFSLQLDVDIDTVSMLSDKKAIFKEAEKKKDELRLVDEYFRDNVPIIHQSPFNKEAIRLYPNLTNLINNKSKYIKIINPLFSPSIIRIFYRWWAYLPLWTGLLWNFKERYSNDDNSEPSITCEHIRYSNALIESYFRTLKQSIFGNKINNRPSEVILKLKRCLGIQFKANEFGVTQSSKGRKRKKKDVGPTEKWSRKGKNKNRENLYLKATKKIVTKFTSKRARLNKNYSHSDGSIRISDSEDSTALSSSNKSTRPSNASDGDISLNQSLQSVRSKSASSSSKSNSKVSSEHSYNVETNSDKSTVDNNGNDHDHQDNDRDSDKRSETSIELNFDADISSPITNTLNPIVSESSITIDQSSKKRRIHFSFNPQAIIDGQTFRWPKFEIHDYFFGGQSYTLKNTCSTDSALFVLYYLYRTDANIAEKFNNVPEPSPYLIFVKTFEIVEENDWDAARLYCLRAFNILKSSDPPTKDLFDYADGQVFSFIKSEQSHSYEVVCTRPDCIQKERNFKTVELNIFSSDTNIEKFEGEYPGVCAAIRGHDEMTEAEALEKQYVKARVEITNPRTNKSENMDVWRCDSINITSPATFDYGHPPVILANIKPKSTSRRSDEGYDPTPVRLRDLKDTIQVGLFEYKLRAVIHHTLIPAHFTATIIGNNGTLYLYDDLKGVKESAWFYFKSPNEYQRRHDQQQQRNIVLDEIVLKSLAAPVIELI